MPSEDTKKPPPVTKPARVTKPAPADIKSQLTVFPPNRQIREGD